MFCEKCGKNIEEENFCSYCLSNESEENGEKDVEGPSPFIAGVLQIFLGSLGIGRFYMKSYKIAIFQILLSAITFGIGGFLWGVIDGCLILSGKTAIE